MTKPTTRTKQTGEIFTPHPLVTEILDKLPDEEFSPANKKTFLDPACGDGEFLRGVVRKFLQEENSPWIKNNKLNEQHLINDITCTPITKDHFNGQIFGVDLMWDNVCDSLYFLLTTVDSGEEINEEYRDAVDNIIIETGFEPHENNLTPDQINNLFTRTRIYQLPDKRKLHCRRKDDHHIEFHLGNQEWTTLTHIVRADSLKEWDFENWKPKFNKQEKLIEDLLSF